MLKTSSWFTLLMLTLNFMSCILFIKFSSPQWLLGVLIIQALISSASLAFMKTFVWSSYVLFLVFLGGMLVIFCYVSSLASYEILEELNSVVLTGSTLLGVSFFTLITLSGVSKGLVVSDSSFMESVFLNDMMKGLYTPNCLMMFVYIVIYLFIALICVANIMKSQMMPLRLLS